MEISIRRLRSFKVSRRTQNILFQMYVSQYTFKVSDTYFKGVPNIY